MRKYSVLYRVAAVSAVLLIISGLDAAAQGREELNRAAGKYNQVLYLIDRLYMEDVDLNALAEKAIVATVGELDPHSAYITAEDVRAMNEPLQGEFEGIGIEFAIIRDTLTVQATVAGGPSEKVGLLAGDKIVRVDSSCIATSGLTNEDVYGYLRGKKGTKVELGVLRRGVKEPLDFTVVRDKIPINSLDAAYKVDGDILYLKLSRFAAKSRDEIAEAIKSFDGTVHGVILDLRSNSGGYLPTSIDIANEFLEAGELIVYTEGRALPRMQESALGNGLYRHGPLVVMIDENSASASEIVAGAIQDQDRGVIVGRRSFGKGLVQQAIPMEDGSELRLTVARYHTPSGRVIQSPYEAGHADEYYRNFYERYVRGESFSRDSIQFPDSLKFRTLKLGRTVYGGGGIMPDVFVPQDTASYSDYYASLLRQGLVIEYVNGLCDRNRSEWTMKYRSFERFDRSFNVTDDMVDGLVALASERGIELKEDELERSREDLCLYMKALVASSIVSRDCFYRVMNSQSPEFQAALEALREASLSRNALL